jgi:hypothetical protein
VGRPRALLGALSLALAGILAPAALAAGRPLAAAGQPLFLSAMVAPAVLPADGQTTPALYLELLSGAGTAASVAAPTPVTLVSSDPAVATVPAAVTIPAGSPLVAVPVTTTLQAGSVTFSARTAGLAAGEATLKTTGAAVAQAGASIAFSVSPATFFVGGSGPASATAELLDAHHQPLVAARSLTVQLVSSAPGILAAPPTLTVPAGGYFATVPLEIGARTGSVTLTALASGYAAGFALTAVDPVGKTPVGLKVSSVPTILLPGTAPRLVLQAVDAQQAPVPYPCGTVYLASDSPDTVPAPASATPACGPDQEGVVVPVGPAGAAGTAAITAAAPGLGPDTARPEVAGSAAFALDATIAPLALAYGAGTQGWLVIQVTDEQGSPVPVPAPLAVTLAGAGDALPATATIPAGRSSDAVPIAGLPPGAAPVVAVAAPGLRTATVPLVPAATAPKTRWGDTLPQLTVFGAHIPFLWVFLAVLLGTLVAGVLLLRGGGGSGARSAGRSRRRLAQNQ